MSLTSLIKDKRSPVATWFSEAFPQTRAVAQAANVRLRGADSKIPCVIAPPEGVDHGTVGTAVGYAVSASLRPDALEQTVATKGAALLRAVVRGSACDPREIEREAVLAITELRPWEGELSQARWQTLSELCIVLTRFEQFFRAGMRLFEHLDEPLHDYEGDLSGLARAFASEVTRRDTCVVAQAAVADLADIRSARSLAIGPTFAQSGALGGADADLVFDGTLIDLKATAKASPVGREELYQLLGYLLADTDDRYEITQVGVCALRRRQRCTWAAQEFLDALAGGPTETLQRYRAQFSELLAPMAQLRQEQAQRRLIRRSAGLDDE